MTLQRMTAKQARNRLNALAFRYIGIAEVAAKDKSTMLVVCAIGARPLLLELVGEQTISRSWRHVQNANARLVAACEKLARKAR